jgi:hypothetical protein
MAEANGARSLVALSQHPREFFVGDDLREFFTHVRSGRI